MPPGRVALPSPKCFSHLWPLVLPAARSTMLRDYKTETDGLYVPAPFLQYTTYWHILHDMERWKHNQNCVFNIRYTLLWCSKYRRQVIVGDVASRLTALLKGKSLELGVHLTVIEISADQVLLSVKCRPTFSPHQLVKQFKGVSSKILRREFPT